MINIRLYQLLCSLYIHLFMFIAEKNKFESCHHHYHTVYNSQCSPSPLSFISTRAKSTSLKTFYQTQRVSSKAISVSVSFPLKHHRHHRILLTYFSRILLLPSFYIPVAFLFIRLTQNPYIPTYMYDDVDDKKSTTARDPTEISKQNYLCDKHYAVQRLKFPTIFFLLFSVFLLVHLSVLVVVIRILEKWRRKVLKDQLKVELNGEREASFYQHVRLSSLWDWELLS